MKKASLLLALALGGCFTAHTPNTIQLSIEQLGSDVASRGNSRTATNITGVSLPITVGMMANNPGANLPDLLGFPQSYGCSRIVETLYPSEATAADVGTVAHAMDGVAEALAGQATVRIKLAILAGAVDRKAAVNHALPADATDDAVTTAVEADSQIKAAMAALGMSHFTDAAVTTESTALQGELAHAQDALTQANAKVHEATNKPNLVVARWSADSQASNNFQLGDIFGAQARSSAARSGYIVMSDLRSASLMPGADFAWALRFAHDVPEAQDRSFGNRYVTTFTLSARNVAFSEDRDWSRVIALNLALSATQMQQLLGGDIGKMLQQESLNIAASLATVASMGTQGLVSDPTRHFYQFRMTSPYARQVSTQSEADRNSHYVLIYSNRATIEDAYHSGHGAGQLPQPGYVQSDAVRRCMQAVPQWVEEAPEIPHHGPLQTNSHPAHGPATASAQRSIPAHWQFCRPTEVAYKANEYDVFAWTEQQIDSTGPEPCVDFLSPDNANPGQGPIGDTASSAQH